MRNHGQMQVFGVWAAVSVCRRVLVNIVLAVVCSVPFIGTALGDCRLDMHVLDLGKHGQSQRNHRVAVGVLNQVCVCARPVKQRSIEVIRASEADFPFVSPVCHAVGCDCKMEVFGVGATVGCQHRVRIDVLSVILHSVPFVLLALVYNHCDMHVLGLVKHR